MINIDEELKKYEKMNFDGKQLAQIKMGLIQRLDVSLYINLELDYEEMANIRLYLLKRKEVGLDWNIKKRGFELRFFILNPLIHTNNN